MIKKILYIEDSNDNFRLITRSIEKFNVEIKQARTAQDAIRILNEMKFDLIVLDILLPDSDIDTFSTRLIKPIGDLSDAPILILTAYSSKRERELISKVDHVAYLTKPVDLNTLRDWVRKILKL